MFRDARYFLHTIYQTCLEYFSACFSSSSLFSLTELPLALASLAAFPAFFLAFLLCAKEAECLYCCDYFWFGEIGA